MMIKDFKSNVYKTINKKLTKYKILITPTFNPIMIQKNQNHVYINNNNLKFIKNKTVLKFMKMLSQLITK